MSHETNFNELLNQSEAIIIGSAINDPDSLPDILTTIKPIHFSDPDYKIVYNIILDLANNHHPIDLKIVSSNLQSTKNISNPKKIINKIVDATTTFTKVDNLNSHIKILVNGSTKQALLKYAKSLENLEFIPTQSEEYFDKITSEMEEIISSRNLNEIKNISAYIGEYEDRLEKMKHHKGMILGTSSGYANIDELTNGFQKGDLLILAARPSIGKTALAINFIGNILSRLDPNSNDCVVMFSLEMSTEQVIDRLLCSQIQLPISKYRSGSWDRNEDIKLIKYLDGLKKQKLFIDDTANLKLLEIEAKLRQIAKKHTIKLCVIDYLQLVEVGHHNQMSRATEVGKISRHLKMIARDLRIPILAIAQLSRKIEERKDEDRKPLLSDLRESGSIEQDADIVTFIDYRRDVIDKKSLQNKNGIRNYESEVKLTFYVEKNRNGRTGQANLTFMKSTGQFRYCVDPNNPLKNDEKN